MVVSLSRETKKPPGSSVKDVMVHPVISNTTVLSAVRRGMVKIVAGAGTRPKRRRSNLIKSTG